MNIIENIKLKAKENIKTIVLPEAYDLRTLKATEIIEKEGIAKIILIGNEEKIKNIINTNNLNINKSLIIDPNNYSNTNVIIDKFYEFRKEKGITYEEAKNIITNNYLYFGCMLVKLGIADGQVSGAVNSSADTLRPALQIIKTDINTKIASAFFLMDIPNCPYGENGVFIYSDCGMNQNPTSEELVEIAKSSNDSFKLLVNDNPKIAFLSHSTLGSSICEDSNKVRKAVELTKTKYPYIDCDGELQLDAAIVKEVAKIKAPDSSIAGNANILIFPDLDAGNIAYKITERLANAKAYGPVTQGLAKPVNDLSRGCNEQDIVGVVAITCLQATKNLS
ncbi:MAG TPA: phosphate acetyltransferase [Bacilli bacterium]|nr:phosphate acetyltransferase [Bacilli bacterium]